MRLGIVPSPRTVPSRENEMCTLPLNYISDFEINKQQGGGCDYHFDSDQSGVGNHDFSDKIGVGIV